MKAMCWIVPPRAIPASPAANNHAMVVGTVNCVGRKAPRDYRRPDADRPCDAACVDQARPEGPWPRGATVLSMNTAGTD